MKTSRPICQHFVKCQCFAVLMVQLRETRVVDSAVVVWGGVASGKIAQLILIPFGDRD